MTYAPHPHHRNAAFATQKSQWTIAVTDEVQTYSQAISQGWGNEGCYWGVYVQADNLNFLGESPLPECYPLKIAKFVIGQQDSWHGYPVAHWLSPYDKPNINVLSAWNTAGLISRAALSRIHRGKKCSL